MSGPGMDKMLKGKMHTVFCDVAFCLVNTGTTEGISGRYVQKGSLKEDYKDLEIQARDYEISPSLLAFLLKQNDNNSSSKDKTPQRKTAQLLNCPRIKN